MGNHDKQQTPGEKAVADSNRHREVQAELEKRGQAEIVRILNGNPPSRS
jgi:hypothetical protein